MAAGLPVITPTGGALAEVAAGAAIDPEAGTKDAPGAALAGSLRRVGSDVVVDAAGAYGRSRFLSRFSPTEGLSGLLGAYRAVLTTRADAGTSPPPG
jgi:hypothetical protein